MFEEKKRTELEDLIAAWIGEVGQLNQAIQALPKTFSGAIEESSVSFEAASQRLEKAVTALQGSGTTNVRAIENISTQTTRIVKGFISEFNEIASHIRLSLAEIRKTHAGVSVDGKYLQEKLTSMNELTDKAYSEMTRMRSLLNDNSLKVESVTGSMKEAALRMNAAVESLHSFDESKLGAHFGSLVVVGGLVTLAAGFVLGYLVKSVL